MGPGSAKRPAGMSLAEPRSMNLRTFEDIAVGETAETGALHVTQDETVAFAREFDPQPFHLDPEAAKHSMLGGLAASGWHTAAMGMRLAYDGYVKDIDSWGGPGIEELKWLLPVRRSLP